MLQDINSLCSVDGTWEPYPTCNGDLRETRDGCDGCPGPEGWPGPPVHMFWLEPAPAWESAWERTGIMAGANIWPGTAPLGMIILTMGGAW